MPQDLLPARLVRLWGNVEAGRLSPDEFYETQERLLNEHREVWEKALVIQQGMNLQDSILHETGTYLGHDEIDRTRRLCLQALARIKTDWHEQVSSIDQDSVKSFYDQSRAMLYELMWWHTLVDDLSPLAYVVAMKFARSHGCENYLDFGSGVGSGGILFARNGISVTLADISSTALNFSSWRFERRGLPATHLDMKVQSLPDGAFDFITAMDVFEHLVDPVGTVRELSRALKQGGFLFGRFHAELDEDRPHHIILDFEPTLSELKKLGFTKIWQDEWLWGHEIYQKV